MSDKNTEGNKSEDKLSDDKKIPELNAELKKIKNAGGIPTIAVIENKNFSATDIGLFYLDLYVTKFCEPIANTEYTLADMLIYLLKDKPLGATLAQISSFFDISKYKIQYIAGALAAMGAVQVNFISSIHSLLVPTHTGKILVDEIINKRGMKDQFKVYEKFKQEDNK